MRIIPCTFHFEPATLAGLEAKSEIATKVIAEPKKEVTNDKQDNHEPSEGGDSRKKKKEKDV